MLSGRGLCDELITRPEESHRLCRVVVCDLETSRIGVPYIYIYIYIYIYDISSLRVKSNNHYGYPLPGNSGNIIPTVKQYKFTYISFKYAGDYCVLCRQRFFRAQKTNK